jgi:hypothetical protein
MVDRARRVPPFDKSSRLVETAPTATKRHSASCVLDTWLRRKAIVRK